MKSIYSLFFFTGLNMLVFCQPGSLIVKTGSLPSYYTNNYREQPGPQDGFNKAVAIENKFHGLSSSISLFSLIKDGEFDTDGPIIPPWEGFSGNGGTLEVKNGVCVITPAEINEEWFLLLKQDSLEVLKDSTYILSFKAWTDKDRTIRFTLEDYNNGYARVGYSPNPESIEGRSDWRILLTQSPETYQFETRIDNIFDFSNCSFTLLASGALETVYIDDIYLIGINDFAKLDTFSLRLDSKKTITCGDTIVLPASVNYHGTGELTYSWKPETGLNNPHILNPLASVSLVTNYVLTVSSPDRGIKKDSIRIDVAPLQVNINVPSIDCGYTAQLNAITNSNGSGIFSYIWSPSNGLSAVDIPNPIISRLENIEYSVTVESLNGCIATDMASVIINPIFVTSSICMVSVDENNKNVIVINKDLNNGIDSFFIYRESLNLSDQYDIIGKLPYSENGIFIDMGSDARVQSNKYKIATKDKCGNISQQSPAHKTIHLSINQGVGNVWNLSWEPYSGVPVTSCKILRGTEKTDMHEIGSTSSSGSTFTDLEAPEGIIFYQIEVLLSQACSNLKSFQTNSIYSNIVANRTLSDKFNTDPVFKEFWYPNPADEVIFFNPDIKKNSKVIIFNIQGKKVIEKPISRELDISGLPDGIYLIEMFGPEQIQVNKLIKK